MAYRLSDKLPARDLAEFCAAMGITHAVLSPGSRNAPLTISFTGHPAFRCFPVADERSAAFFALGIAQQTRRPVVVCCTSGTAVLNFAPAIAEAYYQKVPLLIITADRPEETIDQGDGQTIRQPNVYANYVRHSIHLNESDYDSATGRKSIAEAIRRTTLPDGGPVHVNIAFEEPLYGQKEWEGGDITSEAPAETTIPIPKGELMGEWNRSAKKLVLCGMHRPDSRLQHALSRLAEDPSVAVLTENIANVCDARFSPCVDRLISTFSEPDKVAFRPNLLVTLGDAIVSKMVKKLFRDHPPEAQWNITPGELYYDMFGCLTRTIVAPPAEVLEALADGATSQPSDFGQLWAERNALTRERHREFVAGTPWSDLRAFDVLLHTIPGGSDLQLGNSTPVRYSQLFDQRPDLHYFSNRGTSGIDGATSTAAGAALASGRLTTLITGDIGFFYDANGLWNKHLPPNLRIILMNNGGGNIFRFIPGPDTTEVLEEFIETRHALRAEGIAATHGLPWFHCDGPDRLQDGLEWLYRSDHQRCSILEVATPPIENALILRNYFKHLKLPV
jgi:2-succinyl-5-enolpyruvyl-6-hydroxy-3-cyclohexene-1-carboxylate synthase